MFGGGLPGNVEVILVVNTMVVTVSWRSLLFRHQSAGLGLMVRR